MNCAHNNCISKSESDRLLNCWLCDKDYHIKCLKFTGKNYDFVINSSFFEFFCENCTNKKFTLKKLHRQQQQGYNEVAKAIHTALDKLKDYKNAYTDMTYICNFNDNFTQTSSDTIDNIQSEVLPSPLAIQNSPLKRLNSPLPPNLRITSPISISSSPVPQLETGSQMNQLTSNEIPTNSQYIPHNIPNHHQSQSTPFRSPRPLVVVKSQKAIYLSKFHLDTTEDDILYYIQNKIGSNFEITVQKFKFRDDRSKVATFKVVVDEDIFNTLLNKEFWPRSALVREYVFKAAVLPKRPISSITESSSKN